MTTTKIFNITKIKASNKNSQNLNKESLKDSTSSSSNNSNNPNYKIINTTSLNEYFRIEESRKLVLKNNINLNSFLFENPFPKNFLKKHNLINDIRIKMIDWMIDVFSSYKSSPKTFFLSVNIMDLFFLKTKRTIQINDIHIIGLCSIFIASKMEDLFPLRLEQIKKILGKNKFSYENIKYVEKEILFTIKFDIVKFTIYDFVNSLLFDFEVKYKNQILFVNDLFFTYKNICFFICKLIYYNEDFCFYKNQLKVISIFLIALDILKAITNVNNEIEVYFRNWIFYIMNNTNSNKKKIEIIYEKIASLYQNITSGKFGDCNLLKTHKLIVF